jgi:hypothetical protein
MNRLFPKKFRRLLFLTLLLILICELPGTSLSQERGAAPANTGIVLPRNARNKVTTNPSAELQSLPPGAAVSPELFKKWPCVSPYHNAIDITCFGAVGDGARISDASVEAGSSIVTSLSDSFHPDDVGKIFVLNDGGPGALFLQAKIVAYESPHQITIGTSASLNAQKTRAYWGTDNTQAITNAVAASRMESLPLYVPAGSYFYNGPGLANWTDPRIFGTGKATSVVLLGAHSYFLDDPGVWLHLEVHGITFYGGIGAIRSRFVAPADGSEYLIEDNVFENFSGAAISNNSPDNPYWTIRKNIFMAVNTATSIGVALAGGNDTSTIDDNAFISYRVAIKLGAAGANVHVARNEFLQFSQLQSGAAPRVGIWTLPNPKPNEGSGFVAAWNKFGNENLNPVDLRVLYAEEEPGEHFGDRLPLTTPTAGYMCGQTFMGNAVFGGGSTPTPFIYSYTPNICNGIYKDFQISGSPMGYVIQFSPAVLPLKENAWNRGNICGPVYSLDPSAAYFHPIGGSNGLGACDVIDETGDTALLDYTAASPWQTGTGHAGFLKLLATPVASFSKGPLDAVQEVTDSIGETNAVRINLPGGTQLQGHLTAGPIAGEPIWAEFELRADGTNSLKYVYIAYEQKGKQFPLWEQLVEAPPAGFGWKRYRVRFIPRETIGSDNLSLLIGASPRDKVGGSVALGRVFVYQAWEPLGGAEHLGTVNVDNGMYCLSGHFCLQAGSGGPAGKCLGGIYFRTDNNTVYLCDGGNWKIPQYANH